MEIKGRWGSTNWGNTCGKSGLSSGTWWSVSDQGILVFGTLQTQQRPVSAIFNSLLDADSWEEAQRQSLVGAGYSKSTTNVCEYQSISLSVWPLLFLLQVSWMYWWNHVFFLTAGKTSCGKCGVTQAVIGNDWDYPSKPCWGFFRTQRRTTGKGWGRKESVASSVVTGQALSSQTPGTWLGGGCWGVHFDSLSHNGCLLLLVGFPVIPQSLQTLEFVCVSAYMVRVLGGFLFQRHLWSLNVTFYPNVTKRRHKARKSMLCCLLLDLFVAMSVTQMPICFIFIYSSPKCFTWTDTWSYTRQGGSIGRFFLACSFLLWFFFFFNHASLSDLKFTCEAVHVFHAQFG